MQEMRTIEGSPNYSITRDGKVWNHKLNRFNTAKHQMKLRNDKNEVKNMLLSKLALITFNDIPKGLRRIPDFPNYSITRDGKVWSHTQCVFMKGEHNIK